MKLTSITHSKELNYEMNIPIKRLVRLKFLTCTVMVFSNKCRVAKIPLVLNGTPILGVWRVKSFSKRTSCTLSESF